MSRADEERNFEALRGQREQWKVRAQRLEEMVNETLQLVRERNATLAVLAAGWDPFRDEDGREIESALLEDLRGNVLDKVTRETVWEYAEARGLTPNFTPLMIDLNEEEI